MGLYFRTLEMSRHLRFACFRCPEAVEMAERLVSSTELELTCPTCATVVLIVVTAPIPTRPADLHGVIRYQVYAGAIDHGAGFRCHNCGRRLSHSKVGGPHQCPRCHAWHHIGSVSQPPRRPRVLRSASTASSSPPATPALSAP